MTSSFAFTLGAWLALLAGCSDDTETKPNEDIGTVVVGVTSDLRAGVDVETLHVKMTAGGQVIRDDTLAASATQGPRLAFPAEFAFSDRPAGQEVEVLFEAFPNGWTDPLLVRSAGTKIAGGKQLLLPVRFDSDCATVACPSGQTCIAGGCNDPFVDPQKLPAYSPGWNSGSPDVCKPAGAGDPVVIVGKGMSDYLPMQDLEVAQVEAGPQGGHHIWVAIRLKNLHQSGSITEVTGKVPELGLDVPKFSVIFTFDQDEGGYCKLFGLRFQLDGQDDIMTMLGKRVDVTVTVRDPDGTVGVGTKPVTLSTGIL